jgi:C-terminal processing protease CtpA/Prc
MPTIIISSSLVDDGVFQDVYERLTSEYLDANTLKKKDMLYGAIQGLANSAKDDYTQFFPPTEAKQFTDEMQGEFEGI